MDLAWQWRVIAEAARPDIERTFETSAFCLGPAVEAFERRFADYLGVAYVVGVNSGTSALHLAMIAAGIGPGDAVLLPAHTFVATAWAVLYVGARPVLCDVDEDSGLIDLADAERRCDPTVKAIMPVHLYGRAVDMDAVGAFAARRGLVVIEDAAQAQGAEWRGRRVGGHGYAGCFSFYPGKNLGAAGEAGAIATNDAEAAARMRSLRNHAQGARYVHDELGFNYRMEGLQGVVLGHKLRHLDDWNARRGRIAGLYDEMLAGLPLVRPGRVPGHVWHLYVVRTPERDALKAWLHERGIETGLHYPVPLHRQPCLAGLGHGADEFAVSVRWAEQCLSLPMHPGMADVQVQAVTEAVRGFYGRG